MSRIGKQPVVLPKGVSVTLSADKIVVKGPKGLLERSQHPLITIKEESGKLLLDRDSDHPKARAAHGLMRALTFNMVRGVTEGFERKLEINGVGYKAEVSGSKMTLNLGFSHPILFELPNDVSAKVEKNVITLTSINKESVGHVAAKLRSFRPPEPYKGKGVKYMEERIKRKVGKAAG